MNFKSIKAVAGVLIKRDFPIKFNIKNKKFKKILKIASKNKLYKKLYKDIDVKNINIDNINKLPYTTKDILMDNFEDWINDNKVEYNNFLEFANNPDNNNKLFLNKYRVCSSSGTSKKMFYSLETQDDFEREMFIGFVAVAPTIKEQISLATESMACIIPKNMPYSFAMCCEHYVDYCGNKINIIDVEEPIEEIVKKLNKIQPKLIGGYILTFLELVEEHKKRNININPNCIYVTGDTYRKEQRRLIEQTFNCKSVSMYASTECGLIGYSNNENYYLIDDDIIIELMDKDDNYIKENEISDHVYITCLWRKSTPIIRYKLDDKCLLVENNKQIKILPVGRDTPFIIFQQNEKEIKINGYAILNISEKYNEKVNNQLVIKSNGTININVSGEEADCIEYIKNIERDITELLNKYGIIPNFKRIYGPFEKQKSGKFAELIYKEIP